MGQPSDDGTRTFDALIWRQMLEDHEVMVIVLFDNKQMFLQALVHVHPFDANFAQNMHELGRSVSALYLEGGIPTVIRASGSIRADLEQVGSRKVALAIFDWLLEIFSQLPTPKQGETAEV